MANISNNLRKAAVLIRSLDAETAAALLAQLPPADAAAVRRAVQSIGPIDADEQADVAAELRRSAPLAGAAAASGVELALSSQADTGAAVPAYGDTFSGQANGSPRFEFLERAPIKSLIPYLSREHVQTIAVVLSYLSPSRAAAVLAALPPRQQADTLERLAAIGETDADSLKVVEQELAAWVASQSSVRRGARTGGVASAVLAAADATTRERILANVQIHKRHLVGHLGDAKPSKTAPSDNQRPIRSEAAAAGPRFSTQLDALRNSRTAMAERPVAEAPHRPRPITQSPMTTPRFQFDDLVRLDTRALATVLRGVDARVLVLALAGSSEELVERIASQMPKRTAKEFRRQLRKLSPTRLSDVETAQLAVASAAAQTIGRGAALME